MLRIEQLLQFVLLECILCSALPLFAQQNCNDLQKGFTGTCVDYYETGQLKGKVDLIDGTVICEEVFSIDGQVFEYYDAYSGRSLDIRMLKRYPLRTNVKIEVQVAEGTGVYREFYEKGALKIEGYFKDSMIVNPWKAYHPDGKEFTNSVGEGIKIQNAAHFRSLTSEKTSVLRQMIDSYEFNAYSQEIMSNDGPCVEVMVVEEEVIEFPDVEASFVGGKEALLKWLKENTRYPEESFQKGEQGRVYLEAIVEFDGTIRQPRVLRGVSSSIDAEAIRLVKSMPNWLPAETGGKRIRSKIRIPIEFKLEN